MDFDVSPELRDLKERIRAFIADEIIPLEGDARCTAHGPTEELRRELIAKARGAKLLSPHVSREYGGLALSHFGRAIAFEEAGYSSLGPVALNVFAPDEGNMHLLEAIASPAHKERWLRPLATGELRSCFCMTEPPPGAGSDPSMLATTARRDGDDYIINGTKWFITGADGASFAIIMAKADDAGATMFLSDMNVEGVSLERSMDSLDACFPGGHGVVRFDELRVPAGNILGELGQGFKYAQVRLSPARLTHCMRWLGAARTTSRSTMRASVRHSASASASTRASDSCSPTTRWTCTSPDWRYGTARGCSTAASWRCTSPAAPRSSSPKRFGAWSTVAYRRWAVRA